MDLSLAPHVFRLAEALYGPMRSVLAYLDPGSGSFLLQLLLAGILGGLFVVKMSWSRIKGFFRRMLGRGQDPDEHGR
jgi:hypothetical protein